ncbi:MAG: FtsX-like permease family protein [Bacteroidetes bacterium]|nr:FtsX-like permease family protein [Bacteroidota bacterium]
MTLLYIAWKNLRYRWNSHLLSLLLFSISIGILWAVHEFARQSEEKLKANLAQTDLVIGAKGSPLQIILSSLYHIDAPTGNISYIEAKRWMHHPMIRQAIPLAYGDYYQQYKIIGSDTGILSWYGVQLAEGNVWHQAGDVVLGAALAHQTHLQIGSTFSGQHGSMDAEAEHGQYRVVGILEPKGTVIDQLVLCALETVWAVHEKHGAVLADSAKEVTAVLLRYKNPMAAIQIPRAINENSNLQAAAPSIEINRLAFMLNNGTDVIAYLAIGLFVLAALSMLIQVWMGLKVRKKELALLRYTGYTRSRILLLLYYEIAFISLLSFVFGEMLARVLLHTFSDALAFGSSYTLNATHFTSFDLLLLGMPLLIAGLPLLFNLRSIFRSSVADLLQNE